MAETKDYAYAKDENSLFVTLYGSNEIDTKINGKNVRFEQVTNYPWDDKIEMNYKGDKNAEFSLKLRIPAWAIGATLKVNGIDMPINTGVFAVVNRKWKSGDKVELVLPMKPILKRG